MESLLRRGMSLIRLREDDVMDLEYAFTKRRFPYVTFKDRYDAEYSIQLSSLATDNAIWFGVDNADPKIMARDAHRHGTFPTPEEVEAM